MTTSFGTAALANIFIAAGVAQSPTVSPLLDAHKASVRPFTKTSQQLNRSTCSGSVANGEAFEILIRDTTPQELLIGELRNWALLNEDWDGEGAAKPVSESFLDAVSFARLFSTDTRTPEPMLLASGHAALFWNESGLYADLEFLGGNRIAYFVQKNGDKHKGVASFGPEKMPPVFQALLCA